MRWDSLLGHLDSCPTDGVHPRYWARFRIPVVRSVNCLPQSRQRKRRYPWAVRSDRSVIAVPPHAMHSIRQPPFPAIILLTGATDGNDRLAGNLTEPSFLHSVERRRKLEPMADQRHQRRFRVGSDFGLSSFPPVDTVAVEPELRPSPDYSFHGLFAVPRSSTESR